MRSSLASTLVLVILAVWNPGFARVPREPFSRVENQSGQPWRVAMGRWVAGRIGIRPAGSRGPLAFLKGEGEAYALDPGQAIDMVVMPTGSCLALQLALSRADGQGAGASAYISQGIPGSRPTLNLNPGPAVQMDKDQYGHAAQKRPFILIH